MLELCRKSTPHLSTWNAFSRASGQGAILVKSNRAMASKGVSLGQVALEHWEAMLQVARRYSGRAVTAEDIVQDAFVIACQNPQRVQEVDSARAWLVRVTRNLARQAARKRYRREKLLLQHYWQDSGTQDLESPGTETQLERVLRAAELLPRGQRETLHNMLVHGMPDEGIAAALGVAKATVRSYRFRAIRRLKQLLEEEEH